MADDTEQEPPLQPTGRDISRRSVVVGLLGLVAAEVVAGGVTLQKLSQGIHKIALALVPPAPTPTSLPLGATLYIYRRHTGGVNAVEWSPDGKRIVSGSDDHTSQVWDASTGGHILIYRGHSDVVLAVAWSFDGKHIASGGGTLGSPPTLTVSSTNVDSSDLNTCAFDSVNNVWTCKVVLTEDARSHENLIWSASADLAGVSFNPADGTLSPGASQDVGITIPASSCTNGTFDFAVQGGNAVAVSWTCMPPPSPPTQPPSCPPGYGPPPDCPPLPTPTPPSCPPGFVGTPPNCQPPPPPPLDTTVQVWDATTGHETMAYPGHKASVTAVAWSSGGTRIASPTPTPTPTLPTPIPTSTPTPSPPPPPPLDTTVQVWDATTGREALSYHGHKAGVTVMAWSPDGTRIASASFDKTVRVWDATTGREALSYHGHKAGVTAVAWSPDGTRIASASFDKTVRVWDASTGTIFLTYHGHSNVVEAVAWSPDGKRIASGSGDATVQVWDASSGQTLLTYNGHTNIVNSVGWSTDGKRIASGSGDATVQVWDAATGHHIFTYHGHVNVVTAVVWSPNGTRIASGSIDTTVQIWKAV